MKMEFPFDFLRGRNWVSLISITWDNEQPGILWKENSISVPKKNKGKFQGTKES